MAPTRRGVLIGAAAGGALVVGYMLRPIRYPLPLAPGRDEVAFDAWLKLASDGVLTVAVPQVEMGQGVTTLLPQVVAMELGADWRKVAVEPAPASALYANVPLAARWAEFTMPATPAWLIGEDGELVRRWAQDHVFTVTADGTALAAYEAPLRAAAASARALLCMAAAEQWDVAWEACTTKDGFVVHQGKRLAFGPLAARAAKLDPPSDPPLRKVAPAEAPGMFPLDAPLRFPRLDLPSKANGSFTFAGDVRLPDMVYAAIRHGPIGRSAFAGYDDSAAQSVRGLLTLVRNPGWVAAVATNWWAANKALDLCDPVFTLVGKPLDSEDMDAALERAFASDEGRRLYEQGDLLPVFEGATILASEYGVDPGLHLAMEPMSATARVVDGVVEVWMSSQAPGLARAAIADALGVGAGDVTLYPLHAGGSFGRKIEHEAGVQAALLAREMGRPVQLLWSRLEDVIQDRPSAPAQARMAAKLGRTGAIEGWLAKVAAPCAMRETWARIADGASPHEAAAKAGDTASRLALSGMVPPYAIPNFAIDHYPAVTGLPVGYSRGNADVYGAFFTEAFIDELAHLARMEPMSFRIQMMGGNPRLAHCLTTAAAMGGWQGGIAGSGQGIAAHQMQGSHAAVLVEAGISGGKLSVSRIVAAVDCGDQVNPDIARQQIEGGLIHGLAVAMGASVPYAKGLPTRAMLGRMNLPRLADIGEVTVELIRSTADAGGVSEIAVPPVAPAIANALFTVTGQRFRNLPLLASE